MMCMGRGQVGATGLSRGGGDLEEGRGHSCTIQIPTAKWPHRAEALNGNSFFHPFDKQRNLMYINCISSLHFTYIALNKLQGLKHCTIRGGITGEN